MTYAVRPVTVTVHIDAPPDDVFAFVSDTRNDPMWCPNVSDVTQTDGKAVEVGSRFEFHQTVEARGKTLESDVSVEVLELGDRMIRWRVEDRFQTRAIELTVVPDGEGAAITQITRASFKRKPGLVKWVYPMMAKRTFTDQFSRLATQFED